MSHPVFHLQVLGGLVSRLRAVLGAMAYCEDSERRLVIDWPRNEPSEDLGTFPAGFRDMWYFPAVVIEQTDDHRTFPKRGIEDPEFRTCHIEDFHPHILGRVPEYFDQLKPTAELQALIDAVKLPRPVVGMQIRRAIKAPATVGPEWFFRRMCCLKRDYPQITFFLSADSHFVSSLLTKDYPDLPVAEQRKDYAYDRAGIMKAAADLYLLRQCDWVVGSNHSSYSQLVALLRGAEYKGSHEKHNGLTGGRYEDAWSVADEKELAEALPPGKAP